jgi:hypothetical protein
MRNVSILCLLILCTLSTTRADDKSPPSAVDDGGADLMEMARQMAAPAPQHKLLDPLAGNWKYKVSFNFGGQTGEGTGTTTGRWIMGNRFMQFDAAGGVNTSGGAVNVESMSVLGYDKRTGKFTVWAIDTMGTYSVSATGDFDAASKTFTLHGENEEPGMGKIPFKFVLKLEDATHWSLEVHFQMGGNWQKIVENKYEKA